LSAVADQCGSSKIADDTVIFDRLSRNQNSRSSRSFIGRHKFADACFDDPIAPTTFADMAASASARFS
jgi:hypothetical protein